MALSTQKGRSFYAFKLQIRASLAYTWPCGRKQYPREREREKRAAKNHRSRARERENGRKKMVNNKKIYIESNREALAGQSTLKVRNEKKLL